MQEELKARCKVNSAHLAAISGVTVGILDAAERCFVSENGLPAYCAHCHQENCNPLNTHLYGASEAVRWDGRYIYYCPLGLVFLSACIYDDCKYAGALIAGPLIMGDAPDTLEQIPRKAQKTSAAILPVYSAELAGHLSEQLLITAAFSSLCPQAGMPYLTGKDQEEILNAVYSVNDEQKNADIPFYPIEYEKQLHDLIVRHDKTGAQALLNELLGHIYFASNYDFDGIKARVIELVVLLSRATIEAGADTKEIFTSNDRYIREIERLHGLEELNVWLSAVMHDFINYTFDFSEIKHSDVVYKAMDYIKTNYSTRITLEDIARHVYLSRSYLSTIFKEETGLSITDYIKKVRIEKSKLFLLDNNVKLVNISALCGFEDQSYFTKVFRSSVGVSPKKFRDCRGRIPTSELSK